MKIGYKNKHRTMYQEFCFIIFLFFFTACNQSTDKNNEVQILGEWYPLDENNLEGYYFKKDNVCEIKLCFFDYIEPNNGWTIPKLFDFKDMNQYVCGSVSANPIFDNINGYYGNSTSYSVEKDTLKIYALTTNSWTKQHIIFLSADTMILTDNHTFTKKRYIRKEYTINKEPLWEQIIFHIPTTCFRRDKYMVIKRTGEVISYGSENLVNNFFLSSISQENYEQIETLYKKSDIKKNITTNNNYRIFHNELTQSFSKPTITFVAQNKMETINDPLNFFRQTKSKDFLWAYLFTLSNIDGKQRKPEEIDVYETMLFPEIDFHLLRFETKDKVLDLFASERFYLWNLISSAKETNQPFCPNYTLKESAFSTKQIKTDGRFYQCTKKGKETIVDIGFNFIEENDLIKYFREKERFVNIDY
ncbi:hypothetical protein FACS189434_11390 [Bacteroidia bacterium]|nr:hypothetical protein FACS189434_11390 [Bacteroidia bacterium]